ncbi:hypothetical protein P8452_11670 [Trifolium repens]|nr:hypothetical protein P8452_11670 [Trifolium repens]
MAVEAVGEAFLSAFIEVVLDRLASPQVVDLIRGKKVDDNLVQRLKNTLYAVEVVLNDAEQKQFKDSAVNKWLDDLKDAVYVADDILDHISTKASISNNNKKVSTATATNYFSRFFNFEERDMVCKLEDIVARLEYILKYKDILGLQHIAADHSSWRTPSTSLVDVGSNIFATFLGGEFYFRMEELGKETKIGSTGRHLSFSEFSDPVHKSYDVFGRAKHLRTFFGISFRSPSFNNEKAPCIILSNLKCLRVLSFRCFTNLDALPDSIDKSCDSLSTLPLDNLPNLNYLAILKCENIEHLSASKIVSNLVRIEISDCPKFVSFPREGLSAPNLQSLRISKCTNLKPLPCHINTLLPKLQEVSIDECPEMEAFLEGCMPPSLRSLDIGNCEKLLRNPSLTSLDMISHLSIGNICDGVASFPNKGFALLPPSLTSLDLWGMSSLHTLDCTGLLHLTSLQQLTIVNCPKLENMEGERLPASLIQLQIFRCPLLEERCHMKQLQIWPKISHIKDIRVRCNRVTTNFITFQIFRHIVSANWLFIMLALLETSTNVIPGAN